MMSGSRPAGHGERYNVSRWAAFRPPVHPHQFVHIIGLVICTGAAHADVVYAKPLHQLGKFAADVPETDGQHHRAVNRAYVASGQASGARAYCPGRDEVFC